MPLPRSLQRLVLQPHQIQSQSIELTPEQQHYLCRVLRLGQGEQFIALDGIGHWWLAQLQSGLTKAIVLSEISASTELAIGVSISIAMPKGTGMEDIIRQVTQLGANRIVPLWSDRTVIRSGTELGKQKLDRWQRIAQEASEQSLRQFVPEITPPQVFQAAIQHPSQSPPHHKFICVTHTAPHLLTCLQQQDLGGEISIVTGPEGGWTEAEEQASIEQNWQPVSLGDRILAAVTAPVVALSIVAAVIQTRNPILNSSL